MRRLGARRWCLGTGGPQRSTLGDLVAQMAGTSSETLAERRDLQAVPFASVEVDSARCSVCGLCALCPTGAITQRETDRRKELRFHYRACTGCGLCQKLCPERAIRLTRLLAPGRLREAPRALARADLARCERCGTPIAPVPMLAAVRRRVAARHGSLRVLEGIARLCPACRLLPEAAAAGDQHMSGVR
jgi:Pyruvate/2-oxoacid:ferredoxin oxidoreductase delta subunit